MFKWLCWQLLIHQNWYFCVKSVPGLTRKGFLIKNEEQQKELAHPAVAHSLGAISLVWDKAKGPDLSHTEEEGEVGLMPSRMSTCRAAVPPGSAVP